MARTKMTGRKTLGSVGTDLEQAADNIVATWKPTGFYTASDILTVLAALRKVQNTVNATIDRAVGTESGTGKFLGVSLVSDDDKQLLRGVQERTMKKFGPPFLPIIRAVGDAQTKGIKYIDAPQFKRLVIAYLYEASSAVQSVEMIRSNLSWAQRAAETVASAMVSAGSTIRSVTGVIVNTAIDAVLKVPDFLGSVYKIAPYAALGIGMLWILEHEKRGWLL